MFITFPQLSSSDTIWILEQLLHLRGLTLEGCIVVEDKMQPPLFRTAMLHLFPTRSLMDCSTSMPLDILASCSHLRKLGVQRFFAEGKYWEGLPENTENKFHMISQLEEFHLGDNGQPFLDSLCRAYYDGSPPLNLSRLRSLTLSSKKDPLDIPNIEPMLKTWNPIVEVLTVSCALFIRNFNITHPCFLEELAKSSLISSVTHLSNIKMYVSCSFDLLEPFRTLLKRWTYDGGSGLREIKIEVVWVVAWQEPDSSAIVSLQEILLNHFKKLRRVSLHVDVQNNAGIPSECWKDHHRRS